MKVWLDVANSPHVAFVRPFIERLRHEGSSVVVTARELGNSLSLLERCGIAYERVDGHGGKGLGSKALAFARRCAALREHVKGRGIDVAFTQSSFYVPIVARAAGIPSIYTNDNEHARGNYVAYAYASRVFFPAPVRSRVTGGPFRGKLAFYPGVKEAIYLSQEARTRSDSGAGDVIYFRPEPWLAQYHVPSREYSCDVVRVLLDFGPVAVLPRDHDQREYFEAIFSDEPRVSVAGAVLTLDQIVRTGKLFVGAGGSMSRETAVLGLPTISVYTGAPLAVDDYLCRLGILDRAAGLGELRAKIMAMAESRASVDADGLLSKGREAFEQLYQALLDAG